MGIKNFRPGDQVRISKKNENEFKNLVGKTLTFTGIRHDQDEYKEHLRDGNDPQNKDTCSCCNFGRVEEIDFDFFIEEGDSELELVSE